MKYIRVCYKKYSKVCNLMFFIISIGITLGLIISMFLNKEIAASIYDYFYNTINNYNSNIISNILYPVIVYSVLFILSLTIIGIFIPFLALFIENMSIGLILGILLKNIGFNGLLFGVIYFIFTKLLYTIFLLYLILNFYKFIISFISSLKNKNNTSIYNLYSKIIVKVLFSILVITIYNLIGIFIIPKIIKLFIFLL